jgi:GNAT superfamily N-acetyltransferase
MIRTVDDAAEKRRIAREILEALPEWFGIAEAREDYILKSADETMVASFDQDAPNGFLCLKESGKDTVELAVMGVRKEYHRKGIGTGLFEAAKEIAVEKGYSFLQVKTVQMGRYEEYDRTNRFYQSLGFKEFEVFPTLWDANNPCQIYIMSIE